MRIVIPAAVFFVMLCAVEVCFAFDCAALSKKESFRRADVVFEGEVIRIAEVERETVYTFRVLNLLKGPKSAEVEIFGSRSSCGYMFHPDTVYLVYARRVENKLTTGLCSGTKLLRRVSHNIKRPPRS